jgi:hypothetical protein
MKSGITILFILVVLTLNVKAQEEFKPQVRGAIMMANSHVPTATIDGKTLTVIPGWGIDIDYKFRKRWSVDFQSDIKLQSFEVKDGEAELQRTDPFAIALALHFYTLKHLSFFSGPGYEFEKTKNLWMFKLGSEYGFEISEDFEIGLNLIYENKQEIYDAWTFGIAFNKKLWQKK